MAILSASLFLEGNWSSTCQSPKTRTWSSSQKGWVGKDRTCCSQRGWADGSLASDSKQAVRSKSLSLNVPLSLTYLSFVRFIGHLPQAVNTFLHRAKPCQSWTPWGWAEGMVRQKPAFCSPWRESVCRKWKLGEPMCIGTQQWKRRPPLALVLESLWCPRNNPLASELRICYDVLKGLAGAASAMWTYCIALEVL